MLCLYVTGSQLPGCCQWADESSSPPDVRLPSQPFHASSMKRAIVPLLLLGVVSGCGRDSGTGVRDGRDPLAIARDFELLGDSLSLAGNVNGAEVMRHVAAIVKLTGRVTPVEISVDGAPMMFLAVAEQIDYPIVTCWMRSDSGVVPAPGSSDSAWYRPDTGSVPPPCRSAESSFYSARTFIAWQPDSMRRIVRIVADTGRSRAPNDVPDVMAGLPTTVPGGAADSVVADSAFARPVFYPGFFGEYFEEPGGWWIATQGEEANRLDSMDGPCTRDTLALYWARFACERASLAFEVGMTVVPGFLGRFDEAGAADPRAGESHTVKMSSQVVAGVRLRLEAFVPPPLPLPGPMPLPRVLPSTLDVTTDGDSVTLTFRVSNDTLPNTEIGYSSGQSYDFEIYDAGGGLVWRWSDGMGFTLAMRSTTLRQGETLTFVERWKPASASPRDYVAVARLASYTVRASSRAAFRK